MNFSTFLILPETDFIDFNATLFIYNDELQKIIQQVKSNFPTCNLQ